MAEQIPALDALAAYFTGPAVAHHSIGLQMGGPSRATADLFFAARSALGVSGYADAVEAKAAITRALSKE